MRSWKQFVLDVTNSSLGPFTFHRMSTSMPPKIKGRAGRRKPAEKGAKPAKVSEGSATSVSLQFAVDLSPSLYAPLHILFISQTRALHSLLLHLFLLYYLLCVCTSIVSEQQLISSRHHNNRNPRRLSISNPSPPCSPLSFAIPALRPSLPSSNAPKLRSSRHHTCSTGSCASRSRSWRP